MWYDVCGCSASAPCLFQRHHSLSTVLQNWIPPLFLANCVTSDNCLELTVYFSRVEMTEMSHMALGTLSCTQRSNSLIRRSDSSTHWYHSACLVFVTLPLISSERLWAWKFFVCVLSGSDHTFRADLHPWCSWGFPQIPACGICTWRCCCKMEGYGAVRWTAWKLFPSMRLSCGHSRATMCHDGEVALGVECSSKGSLVRKVSHERNEEGENLIQLGPLGCGWIATVESHDWILVVF